MENFNTMWKNRNISYATKMMILKTCVYITMLYGCKICTYKKADRDRILALEMNCYRILGP